MKLSRILVVDHYESSRCELEVILRDAGFEVAAADGGAAALAAARSHRPDLVISELQLPAMDGLELCRRWHADKDFAGIPFVVYTATQAEVSEERLVLALGAAAYVRKPESPHALVATIEGVLATSATGRLAPESAEFEDVRPDNALLVRRLKQQNQRLEAELESLRISERRSRALLEGSSDGVVVMAADGTVRYASPATEALFGFPPAERIGTNAFDRVHVEDVVRLRRRCAAVEGGATHGHERFRYQHASGGWRWVDVSWTNLIADPAVQGMLLSARDVTDRVADEERLQQAEARFRALVDNAAFGITLATPAGSLLEANLALVAMLGYASREELLAAGPGALYADQSEGRLIASIIERRGRIDAFDTTLRRKDGSEIPARISGRLVDDSIAERGSCELIIEDLRERRHLEAQLARQQRMEALGRLAGGVAHDFNNLLTVISGLAEVLSEDLEPTDAQREAVEEILRTCRRAGALTTRLLVFGRQQVVRPRVVDVNALVGESLGMLRRLIGEDIKLELELEPDLPLVRIDSGQLDQVILNLVVNARDAMPQGGLLAIRTSSVADWGAHTAQFTAATSVRGVAIAIRDSGEGMDAATASSACDPFFTTRQGSGGSGMGLAIAYGVIDQAGGRVEIESTVGVGTEIRVLLPGAREGKLEVETEASAPATRGTERILMVEDDPAVRHVTARILGRAGYDVIEAADGANALELWRQHGPVDLVVTDVVMPGIGGPELVKQLRDLQPGLRALLVSGYAGDAQSWPARAGFLEKPFTQRALASSVREALDS